LRAYMMSIRMKLMESDRAMKDMPGE